MSIFGIIAYGFWGLFFVYSIVMLFGRGIVALYNAIKTRLNEKII